MTIFCPLEGDIACINFCIDCSWFVSESVCKLRGPGKGKLSLAVELAQLVATRDTSGIGPSLILKATIEEQISLANNQAIAYAFTREPSSHTSNYSAMRQLMQTHGA